MLWVPYNRSNGTLDFHQIRQCRPSFLENVDKIWQSLHPKTIGFLGKHRNFQKVEYGKLKRSGKPYRKDLEMEALLEIVEKKRFITCHSYVQSEINMLMKVAEQFTFKVNRRIFLAGFGQIQAYMAGPAKPINVKTVNLN